MPTPLEVALAEYTTLQVGGRAKLLTVRSVEELQEAREIAKQFPAPPLVLGGGSNLLIADSGYQGLVIKNDITGRAYQMLPDTVLLTCGAGEVWDEVVQDVCERGYWGLENLSAIPGSVGATPVQNVGAYGVEVADVIIEVSAVNLATGVVRVFTNTECQFAYRDSFFKRAEGGDWCITAVTFALQKDDAPKLTYADLQPLQTKSKITPQTVREAVVQIRAGKFPDWHTVGTAGSFFKNPIISRQQYSQLQNQYPQLLGHVVDQERIKVSLGWILDNICGLRGYYDGAVGLYEKQALVLVNTGDATASEVDAFAERVVATVKEKTDISIEREVRSV